MVRYILLRGFRAITLEKGQTEGWIIALNDVMQTPKNIDVLFVAGFGPIVRQTAASRKFYCEALGLSFKEETSGYLHTERLDGVKHFALWLLPQVAQSCFGTDQWPDNLPVPQGWIEFDVANIEKATAELK